MSKAGIYTHSLLPHSLKHFLRNKPLELTEPYPQEGEYKVVDQISIESPQFAARFHTNKEKGDKLFGKGAVSYLPSENTVDHDNDKALQRIKHSKENLK